MDETVEGTWRIERPDDTASLAEQLHMARHMVAYDYAARHFSGTGVIADVACGFGVGIEHLFNKGEVREILALDLSRQALDAVPDLPGLTKIRADATDLPLPSGSLSALLAFQLIEHVPREGALQMLKEFQRVLKPGGMAFVTTPNARWRLLPFQKPWNPYHVKEYTPREIRQLCEDAGLESYELMGLMGYGGAHDAELERVRQNPLAFYLGIRSSSLFWYYRKALSIMGIDSSEKNLDGAGVPGYAFHDDYRKGIDFMIVIRNP